MQKIIDYTKQYIGVISIVLAMCILLTYTLSYFMVNTGNKRAAEMYVGELKYSMTIEGNSTNTLSVRNGETIVDVNIINLNKINTYFKLLYLKNSNITISYYNETKDTSDNVTKYVSTGSLIEKNATSTIKLKIINNSAYIQKLTFSISGGYSTNKLTDVEVPSTYSEITTLETATSNTYFCKTTSVLTQGLKYVDGQYTYSYNQRGYYSYSGLAWQNITQYGWGVQLTDKNSTTAVTSNICSYINNKPIANTAYMFYKSKATSIELKSLNTNNVINMQDMFRDSDVTSLDASNFNTSKVTDMSVMFQNCKAESLNLSNFDTSNVTDMSGMFSGSSAKTINVNNFNTRKVNNMARMFLNSQAISIDLSNFDTSNVTDMSSMFLNSQATIIDVSNFDTSNVTDISYMFYNSAATTLDVSNFNTSNVTSMSGMFYNTKPTTLDVSNFDTSKVTDMSHMFSISNVKSLDVSSFDTSKVTNMDNMFDRTAITELKGLNKFNTSNVTSMSNMFIVSQLTTLDLSSFDTSNVTDMSRMFEECAKLTTIYVSDKFVTDNVTNSSNMFKDSTKLVGENGTKYNSSYLDKTYARIDKSGTPGYFTLKN